MDQQSSNEVQPSQTTETTAPSTAQTAAPTTPAAAPADTGIKGAIDAAISKANGEVTKEAPSYTPNWKYKVSGEEKEMDEWVRPAVKDADTEQKLRKLYEDAYGLEPVKQWKEKLASENQELKQNYSSLYNDVSEAMSFKSQGNLDMFFKKVGLTDEVLAKHMLDKINRSNLPPEQQQVYNELDAKRQSEFYQARQLEQTEERYRQIASQAREWEVDQWLAKPEVTSVVQRYDAENGRGAFKQYVAEYGVMHHSTYGEDPTAETAIQSVMKRLGNAYRSQPTSQAPVQQQNNQKQELPIIPNVSGKNVSPTRKTVRSVDELRKIAQEANS